MTIQLNSDNNLTLHEAFRAQLSTLLTEELSRFGAHITRIEAHFSDENGHKEGQNDKLCKLEARLEGMKPILVSNHANNHELAVKGAITKLKTSLDSTLGRLNNH
ncbi:HPF/RaiA family ribosome-associated protein [uncultured Flavobacterium sp.]|jgi:ribosome-associated translation inhibitor RaiA|uniref:HPF/RaiA family ribosome-associated protein n=1 Tax=uncultured Flavobacterium sp. TaxID=165435 RepID=UPI0030ECD14D|tara:strand:+ start:975 stop:1289 length:315 start_codon:yes stop_codon:yes gene_type:complete